MGIAAPLLALRTHAGVTRGTVNRLLVAVHLWSKHVHYIAKDIKHFSGFFFRLCHGLPSCGFVEDKIQGFFHINIDILKGLAEKIY